MTNSTKQTNKRKAMSKKVRFEVFKRDSFICQYCGQSAPDVVLHVDHIQPVSKGGDNDLMNLITSCQACNSGKSDRLLTDTTSIDKQKAQLDELNEKRQQLEMMIEWRETLKDFDSGAAQRIASYFEGQADCNITINESGLKNIRKWMKKFTYAELLEAIDCAVDVYIKDCTMDEASNAFTKIPRICATRKKEKQTGVNERHLYYIRGILKNRFTYCNDRTAIEVLREADALGIDEQDLKDIAIESRNWTEWQMTMHQAMEEEK